MSAVLNRVSGFGGGEPDWLVDGLFALVLVLHGPIDIGLAALTWNLEGNTLVAQLGLWSWVAVKLVAILAAGYVWYDHRKASPYPYPTLAAFWLGIWAGLAVVLILPNAFIVVGVMSL